MCLLTVRRSIRSAWGIAVAATGFIFDDCTRDQGAWLGRMGSFGGVWPDARSAHRLGRAPRTNRQGVISYSF